MKDGIWDKLATGTAKDLDLLIAGLQKLCGWIETGVDWIAGLLSKVGGLFSKTSFEGGGFGAGGLFHNASYGGGGGSAVVARVGTHRMSAAQCRRERARAAM